MVWYEQRQKRKLFVELVGETDADRVMNHDVSILHLLGERVKDMMGDPNKGRAVWGAFFDPETAAKIGTPMMMPEYDADGNPTGRETQVGVWTPASILMTSLQDIVIRNIYGVLNDPDVGKMINSRLTYLINRFTSRVGKGAVDMRALGEGMIETAEELGLPEEQIVAFRNSLGADDSTKKVIAILGEKMAKKKGWSEEDLLGNIQAFGDVAKKLTGKSIEEWLRTTAQAAPGGASYTTLNAQRVPGGRPPGY